MELLATVAHLVPVDVVVVHIFHSPSPKEALRGSRDTQRVAYKKKKRLLFKLNKTNRLLLEDI